MNYHPRLVLKTVHLVNRAASLRNAPPFPPTFSHGCFLFHDSASMMAEDGMDHMFGIGGTPMVITLGIIQGEEHVVG